jgi:hypothetical protein
MTIDPLGADLDTVESLFARLAVPFEARVLAVHRLHVLRLFGAELAALGAAPTSVEAAVEHEGAAAALARAYTRCATGQAARAAAFPGLRRGLVQLGRGGGGTGAASAPTGEEA